MLGRRVILLNDWMKNEEFKHTVNMNKSVYNIFEVVHVFKIYFFYEKYNMFGFRGLTDLIVFKFK